MDLQQDILDSIRCVICNGYLSIFPIWTYENGTTACGRCENGIGNATRAVAFENLAKHFYFPCNYEKSGCIEKFLTSDLHKHENSCIYKTICCPFIGNCSWSGRANKLYDHFQYKHREFKFPLSNQVKLSINNDWESNYVSTFLDQTFLVQIKIKDGSFYFGSAIIGPNNLANLYLCNLSVYTIGSSDGFDFPKQNVPEYTSKEIDISKAFSCAISELGINDCFTLQVTFIQCEEENTKAEQKTLISNLENETFLREIECTVCLDYGIPPLYQCSNGHLICGECKKEVELCPTCSIPMEENIRNLVVERLAEFFYYPCRNEGCGETYKYHNKKEHDMRCRYTPYPCIWSECNDSFSFDELYNHFKLDHSELILDMNNGRAYLNAEDAEDEIEMDRFAGKHGNKIFVIEQKIEAGCLFIGIVYYAPRDNIKKYFCSITFRSNERNAEKLVYKFKIERYLSIKDEVKTFNIPLNLLKPFQTDLYIPYTIDIMEDNLNL